jgi:alkanesulfonate monooxygenase SsuD/methylene tetrahydromethanopterin reductase-like flavin-dependent oxidoreductase (luciferase family)
MPIVGSTKAEAEEIADELADLYQWEVAITDLKRLLLGIELDDLAPGDRVPVERLVPLDAAADSPLFEASRYPNLRQLILDEEPTIRELVRRHTKQNGHQAMIGTADTIATEMQRWFEAGVCDGFIFFPAYMPAGLERFCGEVVPLLQERGVFRQEYPGTTLRDTLGLPHPPTAARKSGAAVEAS